MAKFSYFLEYNWRYLNSLFLMRKCWEHFQPQFSWCALDHANVWAQTEHGRCSCSQFQQLLLCTAPKHCLSLPKDKTLEQFPPITPLFNSHQNIVYKYYLINLRKTVAVKLRFAKSGPSKGVLANQHHSTRRFSNRFNQNFNAKFHFNEDGNIINICKFMMKSERKSTLNFSQFFRLKEIRYCKGIIRISLDLVGLHLRKSVLEVFKKLKSPRSQDSIVQYI